MPRLSDTTPKKFTPHLVVSSKKRKGPEFMLQQKHAHGYLYIDGKKVCRTVKNQWYGFHMIDGKIDHFFKISGADLRDWRDAEEPPSVWCEACCMVEYSDDPDEMPF